jgi:hypothetical protein
MKHLRLLGLALVAMLAVGATVMAVAASAELALPQLLGEVGNPKAFEGKSVGEPKLEDANGNIVNCKAATGSGTQETDTLGIFHITFTGCKTELTGACTSSGDASESILTLGSFHYVLDTLGSAEESVAILFLIKEVTFECSVFAKNKVKGELLCLIQKPLVSAKSHEFRCASKGGKGEQEDLNYWNDKGEKIEKVHLESSLNGGAFVHSQEDANATVEFKEAVKFEND